MIAEVTYSTESYANTRKYNVKMAYKKGKVNRVFEYCEKDLSEEFKQKNKRILSCKRGGGYWVWKPYAVKKAMEELKDGDYLFYCDSGAFLTKPLSPLIDFLEKEQTDILFFELDCVEKEWTKRDIFIELGCDEKKYADSAQRCATYFLLKINEQTRKFVEEWLEYAQKYELISDEENILHGKPNYEGFRDNRHDQSILSVLSKKYGYKCYTDISQYRYPRGRKERIRAKRQKKESTAYPICVCIHRQKKADFTSAFREAVLNYFPKLTRVMHYGYH